MSIVAGQAQPRARRVLEVALTAWLRLSFALMLLAAFVATAASYAAGQSRWLGQSLTWWQELAFASHASLLLFGATLVLAKNKHLRIDLAYARWSPRRRAQADRLFAGLGGLPVMLVLLVTALPWVWRSWSRLETSANPSGLGGLYLVKALMVLAAVQGLTLVLAALFRTPSMASPS